MAKTLTAILSTLHIYFLGICVLIAGCTVPYFRAVDGTDMLVGLSIPEETYTQLQVLNYLNGQKVTVKDQSAVTYKWTHSETNDYFGVVHTKTSRSGEISANPKEIKTNEAKQTDRESGQSVNSN